MVHAYLVAALACAALSACNSERRLLTSSTSADTPGAAGQSDPARPDREARAAGDGVPAEPAPAPATEAVARAILAERFRAAGYRIRHDIAVLRPDAFELTVDGYDPRARVGFEYVAESERDTDIDPRERAALAADPEHRILVIDPAPVADIEKQATDFLRDHAPAAGLD